MTAEFHVTLGEDTSLGLLSLSGVCQKFIVWVLLDGPGLLFLSPLLWIKLAL